MPFLSGNGCVGLDCELYKGAFQRLARAFPVDYYWLWTPEDWTWGGNQPGQLEKTQQDIRAALGALDDLGRPFPLATCGWVLGPAQDRAALDAILPKTSPMACINRTLGHDGVEPSFANITGRPKWAIPWLENDMNMVGPQPWVARMRYDAVDARRFGCTGLFGLHWRTKALEMNVAALAAAGWDQSWVPAGFDATPVKASKGGLTVPPTGKARTMPVGDFYQDYARANFGNTAAKAVAGLLEKMDGVALPEPSTWSEGPGALVANGTPWAEQRKRYAFVDELAALRAQVKGAGNLDRFDYWLNTYRAMATMAEVSCLRGQLDRAMNGKNYQQALAARIGLAAAWSRLLTLQTAIVRTPGELGTIANLEHQTRSRARFVDGHDEALAKALGHPLPAEAALSQDYTGQARLILPTVRSVVAKGESLRLRIIALDRQPMESVTVHVRLLGKGEWRAVAAKHLGRAVYQATLPVAEDDFEYRVSAATTTGAPLLWPATAPEINQTVVVAPTSVFGDLRVDDSPVDVRRGSRQSSAKSYDLASPNGKIRTTVTFDETAGKLTLQVTSGGTAIFAESPLGILTDRAKFTDGMKLLNTAAAKVDETYTLPQGKASTYHNRANELTLALEKDGQKLNVIFRAYDDGIAFRYAIPGTGDIQITEEATALSIAGKPVYWGQSHPNQYGYENSLGRIDNANAFSLALLCELAESKHWILLAQAATYGDYCIPYLTRADEKSNVLKYTFPLNQKEPIKTTLPFVSPWRVAVISPNDLGAIVEQTLFENLNPPTEPELIHADWIKPGRSSWDYIAGDKENWKGWLDFDAEMGWEYHLVDGGWRKYVKDPPAATAYARSKCRGLFAWEFTPKLQEEEAIEKLFKQYAEIGLRGSKIDFFDRLPGGKDTTADSEDTQLGLQVRDRICRIAAKHKIQLVFHGCAIPSGERRRWPHLLGTEAIKGQESDPSAQHDNCIAYIRNPLGPVDWSPTLFGKDGKTDAYQLATSVVFESALLIFAGHHQGYRAHPAKDFLSKVPAAWDETKFIDGYPGSHTVIARRKGNEWFVGGLTTQAREIRLPLDFLESGTTYAATIFQDQPSGLKSTKATKDVTGSDTLAFKTAECGGFVVHLEPADTRWFEEARFGMFIHFGLYSIPAGQWKGVKSGRNWYAEWIRAQQGFDQFEQNGVYGLSREEYDTLLKQFNPAGFNADEWVRLAKEAGMKYFLITAKHHDGFALWPSKASSYNVVDATPFRRDILGELAAACKKHGIKLGFYYSHLQDWGHLGGAVPDWGGQAKDGKKPNFTPPTQEQFGQYWNTIVILQVGELIDRYQPAFF